MTDYVHGYGTPEQERLVEQAEHWRRPLICDGTHLAAGTRLLEVGCGVGAVLAVLGQEYPGVRLTGVDIEPKQLAFARGHLERAGVEATLLEADASRLPCTDESFEHVWMMWLLEHVPDPPSVLREARRVLVPHGAITAIEVDYFTCRAEPSKHPSGGALPRNGRGHGRIRLERCRHPAPGVAPRLRHSCNFRTPTKELRKGLHDLRNLPTHPDADLGWVMHKSTALR